MSFSDHLKELSQSLFDSKKISRCFFIVIVPALLFYNISLFELNSSGLSIMEILRDPAQQSGASSFIGFLSNIGTWLWVSSAAICFFTLFTSNFSCRNSLRELIFLMGLLSILLAIDDFFLIHDRYISQKICYPFYAVSIGGLLLRHFKQIIKIEGFAFLLAGSFLALSIFTDLVQRHIPLPYHYVQIGEEGFKFVGAATWLYFVIRVASSHPASFSSNSIN